MPAEHLPQPPPGVPAPPPGEEAIGSRKRFRIIVWLGVVSLLATCSVTVFPFPSGMGPKTIGKARLVKSMSGFREIQVALFDFENQYSSYPDVDTAVALRASIVTSWKLGDSSSNDLFQQLFAAGLLSSEDAFYFPTKGSREPDNDFSSETTALASGECELGYILPDGSPSVERPLVVAPIAPGTTSFDPDAFDGKALILRADNTSITLPIDATGRAILNGMDLFDPRQPFWHGKAPVVKWPK